VSSISRFISLFKVVFSLVEGMVEGTRGRGRKRTNWVDNVTRYAGMGINDCARKAMDRKGWRIVVSNVVADTEQR